MRLRRRLDLAVVVMVVVMSALHARAAEAIRQQQQQQERLAGELVSGRTSDAAGVGANVAVAQASKAQSLSEMLAGSKEAAALLSQQHQIAAVERVRARTRVCCMTGLCSRVVFCGVARSGLQLVARAAFVRCVFAD